MSDCLYVVVTTIHPPTPGTRRLAAGLPAINGHLVVVGDRKGPASFALEGPGDCVFLSFADQARLDLALAPLLPSGSYSRKNLGYLHAIRAGATCLYETDDDNAPNASWRPRSIGTAARAVTPRPWANVYRWFTDAFVWPRGFPLEYVRDRATWAPDGTAASAPYPTPIQQGLVDEDADVDAVWRLLADTPVVFRQDPSVWLPPGTWCPFNSQCTWWWSPAYPLLYLPAHCPMRMTDIWRSFVAQRCLWELGCGLVFHAPEAIHARHAHDVLDDLRQEVPGYLGNVRLTGELSRLTLTPGPDAVGGNLTRCYEALVAGGFLPVAELPLVQAWLADLARVTPAR